MSFKEFWTRRREICKVWDQKDECSQHMVTWFEAIAEWRSLTCKSLQPEFKQIYIDALEAELARLKKTI